MKKMHRIFTALTFALTCGGAAAFDPTEQQVIDALQIQILDLQSRLDVLIGADLTVVDAVTISWLVVACLAVGFTVRLIRSAI